KPGDPRRPARRAASPHGFSRGLVARAVHDSEHTAGLDVGDERLEDVVMLVLGMAAIAAPAAGPPRNESHHRCARHHLAGRSDQLCHLLNLAAFVEPFADRLLGSVSNTPFTVGIFADWGQGKTTVMRMLQASLRRHDCPTVWFDPWKYNSREAVWKGLALTLIEEVRAHDSLRRELKRKQNSLTEFGLKALVGWLVGRDWAADVVQAVKTEPWSPALLHELEADLRVLFESVSPGRVAIPRPWLRFVHDLDRCLPQAALAVLEALKLVLSRPGLITIMGIAEHELSRAVFAAYAKELESLGTDFDRDWGRRYIQKIIQMPFPPPIVTEASMDENDGQCLTHSGDGDGLGA